MVDKRLEVIYASIQRRIQDWHESDSQQQLYEYLGWTEEEFQNWADDPNDLPSCESNKFRLIQGTPG
jgi:hypothetical protein